MLTYEKNDFNAYTKVIVYTHKLHHKPFKLLVPNYLQVSGLLLVIRKKIKLQSHQAIFLFQDQQLIHAGQYIALLPKRLKPYDTVHIDVALENTFG